MWKERIKSMGKSLVAVNAGPRVKWNTDTLINEAIKGAKAQGATVQKFDLFRLEKYTGYISCQDTMRYFRRNARRHMNWEQRLR